MVDINWDMRMQKQISYLLVIMAICSVQHIANAEQLATDLVQDYIIIRSKVTACMWFQTDYCSVSKLAY